eukprot:g15685.t1
MTTVGYGDYVPKSAGGYVIMSLLTIASVLFLAMPVGIIGNEFNLCWQGRDQVLSISRIQKALLKWGYAAADVRQLFEYVDEDGDGQLNFSEFLELFSLTRIRVATSTTRSSCCRFFPTRHRWVSGARDCEVIVVTGGEDSHEVASSIIQQEGVRSLQAGQRPSTPVRRYRVRLSAGSADGPTAQLEVSYGRLYPMETPRLLVKVSNLTKDPWQDLTQRVAEEAIHRGASSQFGKKCLVVRLSVQLDKSIPLYERMQRREAEEAKLKEEAARHDRELAKKRAVEEWEKQKQAERQRMERGGTLDFLPEDSELGGPGMNQVPPPQQLPKKQAAKVIERCRSPEPFDVVGGFEKNREETAKALCPPSQLGFLQGPSFLKPASRRRDLMRLHTKHSW